VSVFRSLSTCRPAYSFVGEGGGGGDQEQFTQPRRDYVPMAQPITRELLALV
jgi:hypothetical protein